MADITPTATPPLSRGSSFQRMLELEKRYKLERLQSDQEQSSNPPSSPTEPLSPRAPLQLRRANSLSQQQQDLMLKAVRRSIAPPPLSIAIPPPNVDRSVAEANAQGIGQERESELDLENVESLQKSVKFLAPDSDEEEESDQSSICHSPSWEGYGQKKKDKKKEAERKRKAKEQKDLAEREAKAAKKRGSSRLSKAAPLLGRQMPTVMERSNSAPVLSSNNFRTTGREHYQMPTVDDEQEYTPPDLLQHPLFRSITPDSTELLDSANSHFIGGLKLQQMREAALQHAMQTRSPPVNGLDPRQRIHKSFTTNDMSPPVSGGSSLRNDSRSSRESCPPSASRTPMLRHNSAQPPTLKTSRGRDSKNYPVTSSYSSNNHSQESLQPDGSSHPGGLNDGYVRHQRDKSTERALAGLLDKQLVQADASSSSTRSSSQHTRRSSLSRDVKAAAMRLTGHRGASMKRAESTEPGSVDQGDYFNYVNQPRSPSAIQTLSSSGGVPPPSRSNATQAESTSSKATQESASSEAPGHTGAAKPRSLKDVARAALHMSPSQNQVPTFRPTVKPPPYYILRAKFSSSSSVPTLSAPTSSSTQTAQPSKPHQSQPTSAPSTVPNQPGSRVSEGSSSSSNYDDGSPLPSPVTTPDTSRPQSSKGPTVEAVVQDDARTLRQVSETTSSGSSSNVTPRLTQYDDEGNEMAPEDRWSRTAMPMDIDFDDAQSTVSDYSDAREEPVKIASAPAKLEGGTGPAHGQRFDEPGDSFGRNRLSRSHSDPDLTSSSMAASGSQGPAIPHRSKARQRQEPERPKTASAGQQLGKEVNEANQKDKEEPRKSEQRKKKLRKQKPVPETKQDGTAEENTEVIERASDDFGLRATQASASTSLMSARFMSPIGGFIPSYGFASNPLFVDFSELSKGASTPDQERLPVKITATQITFQTQAAASKPVTERVQTMDKVAAPEAEQHQLPAPDPAKANPRTASTPAPTAGPRPTPPSRSTTTPVSILKPSGAPPTSKLGQSQGPALPPVLSAIPKHLQPPTSARSQALAPPELRMAPIAKMFVECCSCKFYHDMPSKLYECMAKPDAVVEDKLRGISGAITTMVKCPWCQHNMSTSCCAGYAAVVYLKEKLH